jgi:hypothetical protein
MARPKKSGKDKDSFEDEKHPLEVSSEESQESEIASEDSVEEKAEEILPEPKAEESKKVSGSPLGKVRGKDLKNY